MADAQVVAVIPSRLAAQRFPEKPLAIIAGKPMIQRVWEAASKAQRVQRVIVATDSKRIADVVHGFGGEAVLTEPDCPSGTDRVAEVARNTEAEIIINVQGDEPLLSPHAIDRVVSALQNDSQASMSTAVRAAESDEEWQSRNAVKAVIGERGYALYFSRAPIPSFPSFSDGNKSLRWIHLGLYGFRRQALFEFASMAPTSLELEERLEQLRALENGWKIRVVTLSERTCAVDIPGDVLRVEAILAQANKRVSQ